MSLYPTINKNRLKDWTQALIFACFALNLLYAQPAKAAVPTYALVLRMEAKPGQEKMLEDFLRNTLQMAQSEKGTTHWFAAQGESLGMKNIFYIFDTFHNESDREGHLNGKIAEALMAKSDELLTSKPTLEKIRILAAK